MNPKQASDLNQSIVVLGVGAAVSFGAYRWLDPPLPPWLAERAPAVAIGVGLLCSWALLAWKNRSYPATVAGWSSLAVLSGLAAGVGVVLEDAAERALGLQEHPLMVVGGLAIVMAFTFSPLYFAMRWGPRVPMQAAQQGDLLTACKWAELIPTVDNAVAAYLRVEMGDLPRARDLLTRVSNQRAFARHTAALIDAEEGRLEPAWEALRRDWEKDSQIPDALTPALGIELGKRVDRMLDAMQAKVGGMPHVSVFTACRAWALASQGREEAARDALPTITDLPPLLATERDYLYGRALHALGDPEWRSFLERAAAGVGRTARLSRRFLDQQDSSGPALVRSHPGG